MFFHFALTLTLSEYSNSKYKVFSYSAVVLFILTHISYFVYNFLVNI